MATQVTTGLLANNAVTDDKLHADFTATTQSASDNSTSVATTAYVTTALANLVDSAPGTLNTLNELAAALGDDANFSTTVTNSIATKAPLASPTFTSNINGGDGVELRLGDSQDILFKHHASGYGHLENKNGTFYIDSETFDIRTDIDNASLAIGIDANQRVGINQTPSGTNFSLQVTGQQTDGSDARAAYFKGYGTHTSIGSTGPTVVVQNANSTTNNYAKLSFESANAGETVSINAQNIDHTNHYGDMAFNTRGSGGYSEKMRITSNGNIGIGNTNPSGMHANANKLVVGTGSGDQGMSIYAGTSTGRYAFARAVGNNTDAYDGGMAYDGSRNLTFHTNAGAERMRIDGSGNVAINMGSNTTAIGQHKFMVNTGYTNGNVGSDAFVHVGPISGGNSNSDGYISGISLGYHENNNSYKHTAIAVRAHGDSAARRDMLFLVNTAAEAASAELSDAKLTISSGNGKVTIGNTSGISDYYVLKVLTTNGHGSQGSHNSSYYHHDTDRLYYYWNKRCEASGGFHTYSDERLKEEITPVIGALDSVAKMNGVTFKWKNADERGGGFAGKHFGVIAQNMLEVDSELPTLNKDPLYNIKEDVKEDDEYYTMDYSRLSPYFIEAIKELKTKLEAAEARITELEG